MAFIVEIVRNADDEVVWASSIVSNRSSAERMERGASRNLDYSRFTVRVREVDDEALVRTKAEATQKDR